MDVPVAENSAYYLEQTVVLLVCKVEELFAAEECLPLHSLWLCLTMLPISVLSSSFCSLVKNILIRLA